MPSDNEDSASPTLSRSKRVSIGSSIASRAYARPPQETVPEPLNSPDEQNLPGTPLTPEQSPPSRTTQKRSVDQIDDEEQSTPSHSRESSEAYQPCLCRADPKVPRPRNAFILYRQHHNAEVVKQNPGVNNPDISKIIGTLWGNEPEEEKSRWKRFAEEEKIQHQLKYPSYRYQPRRTGRRNSASSDTTPYPWSELKKCNKCGGRAIAQPGTPSTSTYQARQRETEGSPTDLIVRPIRANTVTLPPPTPSSLITPTTRYLPMMNNLSLDSPGHRMTPGHPPHPYAQSSSPQDMVPPMASDMKRRRLDKTGGYPGNAPHMRANAQRVHNGPGTPFPFATQQQQMMSPVRQYAGPHPAQPPPQFRRVSLPPATELIRGPPHGTHAVAMAPPPRPGMGYSQHRASAGRMPLAHDLNLTLPPLQTNGPPTRPDVMSAASMTSAGPPTATLRRPDTRTPTEIIMSMPIENKLSVFRKLYMKLPSDTKRATIIAVEGDDAEAARDFADCVADLLSKDSEIQLTVVNGPNVPQREVLSKRDLFNCVNEWDDKSLEIQDMVTANAHKSVEIRRDSSTTAEDTEQSNSAAQTSSKESAQESMELDSPATPTQPKHVLLLRTHSLTATNLFACRVPVTGEYGPENHWQWAACTWRDVIGPDMTIYLKDVDSKAGADMGQVDIVDGKRLMVVRRARSEDAASEKSDKSSVGGVDAGALRRLGFEVGEWVRSR
ncbi:hypothetical protein MBLNU457_4868t2 [Dothideomycetes sp. NU457]